MKKKNSELVSFVNTEKQLTEIKSTECDGVQSQIIELLKQIVNQNEQVIQLLTKLKERFI